MNLVAKEGPVVNDRNGILVLSRTAGAFQQLGKASVPTSPTDVMETAEALYNALNMPPEERHIKSTLARQIVERNDLQVWLSRQINDVNDLLALVLPQTAATPEPRLSLAVANAG
jgi:trehalose 6-phosphate synthase